MNKYTPWKILLLFVCLLVLGGCAAPATTPQTTETDSTTGNLITAVPAGNQAQETPSPTPVMVPGDVTVSDAVISDDTNNPAVKLVVIKGDLPSSCSQVQVDIKSETDPKKIAIKIFSARPKDASKCSETAQSYETRITLAGYTPGEYAVSVNEKEVAAKVDIK